jgi:hypothetical protein
MVLILHRNEKYGVVYIDDWSLDLTQYSGVTLEHGYRDW